MHEAMHVRARQGMLGKVLLYVSLVAIVSAAAILLEFLGLAVSLVIPIAIAIVGLLIKNPSWSLHAALIAGFFATGLSRYIPAPTGLMIDAFLALGLLIALFQREKPEPGGVSAWLPAAFAIWMAYSVLQLANPVGGHPVAWFYAMRGVAMYPLLIAGIGYLLQPGDVFLKRFLYIWVVISVLGTLWGFKQLIIGLDPFEQRWLAVPGNFSTHMLFGKLRVFSFYSESGQFGAAQGHTAVLAGIMALGRGSLKVRVIWAVVAVLSILGLLISGTRGAMAVPAIGGFTYLIMCRNWKLLFVGFALMGTVYGGLKYTYIGQNIYEVRRMRTAVVEGSDNASLQVRKENQKRLAVYLSDKPFGGGVGSAGYWGQRFTPGTFLADLALDSWYVKIWAEYGIVGLSFYGFMLLSFVLLSIRSIKAETDPDRYQLMLALLSGFTGILMASYGNQVLGQVPTGVIIMISLLYLIRSPREVSS